MGLCIHIALSFYYLKPNYKKTEYRGNVEIIDIYKEDYICKLLDFHPQNRVILKAKNVEKYRPGDIINVSTSIEFAQEARNYRGFNYRKYLQSQKIYGLIDAQNYKKVGVRKDIYYYLGNIRLKCFEILDELYDTKYSSFLKGVLYGYKNEINNNIKENFRDSSLSHIIAISGMHISYVVLFLDTIFSLSKIHKKMYRIMQVILLIIFMIFTGMSPSCVRACLMYIYALIGKCLDRKPNIYIGGLISILHIIAINIYSVYNLGFWLSYFSTLGIICTSGFIHKIILKKINKNNSILQYIIQCFSISLASQIFIMPITIYSSNFFSLSFFIPNILMSILIGPIILIGYISTLFFVVFKPFSILCGIIEMTLLKLAFNIAKYSKYLPFSTIHTTTPSIIVVGIYYMLLYIIIRYSYKNKYSFYRMINKKKYTEVVKKPIVILVIVVLIIVSFVKKLPNDFRIYFIDVGQGDSCLIVTPNNKSILVDGGEGGGEGYDYGKNVVFPYLLDRGIKELDYMIISHFDSDHVGGLFYVLENIRVKKVVISIQGENSENLERLRKIVKKKKQKVIVVKKGDNISIERDVSLKILWPRAQNMIKENILNNNSMVCKLSYKNFSMLFTGDIEEAEKDILKEYDLNDLQSTILKVAHHGSNTSSSQEFVDAVNPQIALIGVGENNKFNHPSEEVIERLKIKGIKIFRTDQMGEISIVVDRNGKMKIKKRLP